MENKKITSALISVFDKNNLKPLIKELVIMMLRSIRQEEQKILFKI